MYTQREMVSDSQFHSLVMQIIPMNVNAYDKELFQFYFFEVNVPMSGVKQNYNICLFACV